MNAITIHRAKRDIIDLYDSPFTVRWTDQIQQAVAVHFGVTIERMASERRDKKSAYARFAAMYLIRKYRHYSLPRIGAMFGNRDHTTVLSALRRVNNLCRNDAEFAEKLRDAEAFLIGNDTSRVWPAEVIAYLKSSPLAGVA